jgi:hypothetical protein
LEKKECKREQNKFRTSEKALSFEVTDKNKKVYCKIIAI